MHDLLCLVLSLPRAVARRLAIGARLAALGIPFEFVEGADGRHLPPDHPDLDLPLARRRLGRPMLPGEMGCALGHAAVYRRFLASGAAYALVLEDDAEPDPALAAFLAEGHYRGLPMALLFHRRAHVLPARARPLCAGHAAHRLANTPHGCVAYTLDRASAARLLSAALPVRWVADWPLELPDLGAHAVLPPLVGHPPVNDPAQSLIGGERGHRRRPTLRERLTRRYLRRKWRLMGSRRVS